MYRNRYFFFFVFYFLHKNEYVRSIYINMFKGSAHSSFTSYTECTVHWHKQLTTNAIALSKVNIIYCNNDIVRKKEKEREREKDSRKENENWIYLFNHFSLFSFTSYFFFIFFFSVTAVFVCIYFCVTMNVKILIYQSIIFCMMQWVLLYLLLLFMWITKLLYA